MFSFLTEPSTVVSAPPDVMFSEVLLIFFVLAIWLSAIGFCLHQYKSLRRLETQVHYFGDRKDPLNIGDIKIVSREQDSIIYHKKRYSTMIDTHVKNADLRRLHYIKDYIPASRISPSGAINALVIGREDLVANVPLSVTSSIPTPSAKHLPLSTHEEVSEDQTTQAEVPPSSMPLSSSEADSNRTHVRPLYAARTGKDCPFTQSFECVNYVMMFSSDALSKLALSEISSLNGLLLSLSQQNNLIYLEPYFYNDQLSIRHS